MKNPFINDDNLGIVASLVGLVLIVFVALAMSLFARNNKDKSDQDKELAAEEFSEAEQHIISDKLKSKIDQLKLKIETHHKHQRRKSEQIAEHRKQAELLVELQEQITSANEEISILRRLIANQRDAMELITKGKEDYRLRRRDFVRAEAHGETYDSVTTRLGKTYEQVKIVKVSPLGISLSHRYGAVLLDFYQMPREWQKKYMYTAEELNAAKQIEEQRQTDTRKAIAINAKADARRHASDQNADAANKMANLRRQIAVTNIKLASAKTEARLARNKASYHDSMRHTRTYSSSSYRYYSYSSGRYYGSYYRPRYRTTYIGSRSVPGSLRTWDERATHYERLTQRYTVQLEKLNLSLNELSAKLDSRGR